MSRPDGQTVCVCQAATQPLAVLHGVVTDVAWRFVLLEVHAWAAQHRFQRL